MQTHRKSCLRRAAVEGRDRRPSVLCVDDDPEILRALAIRLRNFDLEVLCASYGMQGITLAEHRPPDLVITDLRMPRGHGSRVVERLKQSEATASIPIIVLTGDRSFRVRRLLVELGVADYLLKPLSFTRLERIIGQYVDLRDSAAADSIVASPRHNSAAVGFDGTQSTTDEPAARLPVSNSPKTPMRRFHGRGE